MEGADQCVDGSDGLSVMMQTARECGVENGAPEPPADATTSKPLLSAEGSPINTHTNSLMRRPPKREEKHNGEEKPLRWSVDKVSMAGVGEKHCTNGTSSQREGFSVVRRASASHSTAATTTPASSSGAGRLQRRASSSSATAEATPSSSTRAGSLERRASTPNATAAITPTASSSRAGKFSLERRASASNATAATTPGSSRAGFFGSFDDSRYWDYAFRFTSRQDIGNKCRECKRPFVGLNEEIVVRR